MTSREATAAQPPSAVSPEPVGLEQAEAALVENYARLVRIAYLVLPPSLGRNRRVLTAHSVAQRALPRNRAGGTQPGLPAQRTDESGGRARGAAGSVGYAFVRLRVLRAALAAGRPRRRWQLPRRAQLPPLFPHVWGLRLFPRSGGADELALDQALSALSSPARAAYVLRTLERLTDREVRGLLEEAGARDARAALAEADDLAVPSGSRDELLLESPEFDPCSLQARPTDLLRRRQHLRAALAAAAAVIVCGALLGVPGGGWGPDGAAAPPYARNPASEKALDPASLTKAPPGTWLASDRTDFSTWPARGNRTGDRELLRRALAVWARPGRTVQVSATLGTTSGPPPGPAQLLYAGEVDRAAVVLLYDGLRVVRYAEAKDGESGGAVLDFARTDGADATSATALVVGRTDGNVRYLTAPWVSGSRVLDLLRPTDGARPLHRTGDGVTDPVPSPVAASTCHTWSALELRTATGMEAPTATEGGSALPHLVTDLGELTPARLTYGNPAGQPRDVTGSAARASWARTVCHLSAVRSLGVRAVNSWHFATQPLPGGGGGSAAWVCTRAETWRGGGSRVMAHFQPPTGKPSAGKPSAEDVVAAQAGNSTACGPRAPRVLAGVLWKSRGGQWYVLAAGSPQVTSITASGGALGSVRGSLLALPAERGARAELDGRLADGEHLSALH
ncbi:hypothetical protein ABZW18_02120 [Streptomyces sp. NPDC004647]|uniref:hypothetical protein n=1 Tax=Streptomyces sp. NPDC004647 TaxID=3154671 RepID=UPI0033B08832